MSIKSSCITHQCSYRLQLNWVQTKKSTISYPQHNKRKEQFPHTLPMCLSVWARGSSEIPAVGYCKDGICTSLGTSVQGMYTKILLRSNPEIVRISLAAPHFRLAQMECVGESYGSIYKSNGLFPLCFPIHNENKKGIFTCYLDNEKLYFSCFEISFPPKLLLCYIITVHLS